jgi:hypothetical protein
VCSSWVNGNLAYLADGTNGLYAVDVSNPAQVRLVDHILVSGRARDVRYQDSFVYLAANEGGLRINPDFEIAIDFLIIKTPFGIMLV